MRRLLSWFVTIISSFHTRIILTMFCIILYHYHNDINLFLINIIGWISRWVMIWRTWFAWLGLKWRMRILALKAILFWKHLTCISSEKLFKTIFETYSMLRTNTRIFDNIYSFFLKNISKSLKIFKNIQKYIL